ncbi:MAG: lysophospholipid acyltransferase family protein [Patescibacteria group bacterium]|jgi:1-acyl-sn-glycerol-3-phosphate acyltransferase
MSYPFSRHLFRLLFSWRIDSASGLENIPRTGPVILVSNHVGEQDPPLLVNSVIQHTKGRKVYVVTKWKILWFSLWRNWMGIVPLFPDRSKTFKILIKLISGGEIVLMYPEGGLNVRPVINRVKTGVARLALMTKTPIIPVGLERTAPPPKTHLGFVLEIFYAHLRINIGQPIDLSPWYGKTVEGGLLQEVNSEIMSAVAKLANKKYEPE